MFRLPVLLVLPNLPQTASIFMTCPMLHALSHVLCYEKVANASRNAVYAATAVSSTSISVVVRFPLSVLGPAPASASFCE